MRRSFTAGAALLALAACGGSGSPAGSGANTENSAIGSYATPGGRAEVRAGDAALSGLPEGIPPYPRADARGAIEFGGPTEEGEEARMMGFRTSDPAASVIAFYAEAGQRAGFREIQRTTTGQSEVIGLRRDNGDIMNITATGTPGGTHVQIMSGREHRRR